MSHSKFHPVEKYFIKIIGTNISKNENKLAMIIIHQKIFVTCKLYLMAMRKVLLFKISINSL